MEQRVTKNLMKKIIKRQPKIVLQRLDLTKIESLGVRINGLANKERATKTTVTRMTLRNRSATKTNQKVNISKQTKPVKTVALRVSKEVIRTTTAFRQNNIVLVKWPYFPDWPAVIESIKGNSIHVKFFGDGR